MASQVGRCPVCSQNLSGKQLLCSKCNALHHEDCWNYNGACAIYACQSKSFISLATKDNNWVGLIQQCDGQYEAVNLKEENVITTNEQPESSGPFEASYDYSSTVRETQLIADRNIRSLISDCAFQICLLLDNLFPIFMMIFLVVAVSILANSNLGTSINNPPAKVTTDEGKKDNDDDGFDMTYYFLMMSAMDSANND